MQDFVHSQEFKQKCDDLQLDTNKITKHFSRIKDSVLEHHVSHFTVEDTCRLDNDGIVDISEWKEEESIAPNGYLAFIPAAGVSSRYFDVLKHLKVAIEDKSVSEIKDALIELRQAGDTNWHLPKYLKKLLSLETEEVLSMDEKDLMSLASNALGETYLPKALLPYDEKSTFLERKFIEHEKLPAVEAQVFVVGNGKAKMFEPFLERETQKKIVFLEQSPPLSTIRFDSKLNPVFEKNGELSLVPAGHGVLTALLWKAKRLFPKMHSAFIKNIDNTVPTDESSLKWQQKFLSFHQTLVDDMNKVRTLLDTSVDKADKYVSKMYKKYCGTKIPDRETQEFLSSVEPNTKNLWAFLCEFFHLDPNLVEDIFTDVPAGKILNYLYMRPVNTMGQVPNTQNNVGGTPMFVRFKNSRVKVCLEAAHSSKVDLEKFFKDSSKATHFNPVYVAAELNFVADHYERYDDNFWILAKKSYKAKTVYYHESVLYELLGNSIMANVVFVEIPRFLFNPHKSVDSKQA